MARNIHQCTRRQFGRLYCAFMRLEEDPETGRLQECGCVLKRRDEYRLYPEHRSDGTVVSNRIPSSDPFPPGVSVIWENDTSNDNGLTFSFRRLRAEEYNMHPLYNINDINEPFVSGTMGDNHVGYAFGTRDVCLSPGGWANQKILGLQRVEDCNMGIYGKFDKVEKMVLPKCLRDYTGDVKGWVNYTSLPDNPRKKTFFACDESNEKIAEFCVMNFGKTPRAAAIYQILIAIKHGEYINLWEALINHGIPETQVRSIMSQVSTKSRRTLYSNMNLQKYYMYWKALGKMGLSREKLHTFRCNLINYVLNYPGLHKIDPEKPPVTLLSNGEAVYPTNRRFWWVGMMVKDALAQAKVRPILTNPQIKWFKRLMDEMRNENSSLRIESDLQNPAIENIYSIIGGNKESSTFQRKVRVFSRLLMAGKRWAKPEVRLAWAYFEKAYDAKDPARFWQFVESVKTSTPSGLAAITREAEIEEELEISPQRAFAHHLLEARKSRTSFEIEEPKLIERWSTITPKYGKSELDDDKPKTEYPDIFWGELHKVWSTHQKRAERIVQIIRDHFSDLSIESAQDLAKMYQEEINENVFIGTSISKDDLGREGDIHIEDIDENEEIGGDEWHDSESAE